MSFLKKKKKTSDTAATERGDEFNCGLGSPLLPAMCFRSGGHPSFRSINGKEKGDWVAVAMTAVLISQALTMSKAHSKDFTQQLQSWQAYEVGVIILILQVKKWRLRKFKYPGCGHRPSKVLSQDFTSGSSDYKTFFFPFSNQLASWSLNFLIRKRGAMILPCKLCVTSKFSNWGDLYNSWHRASTKARSSFFFFKQSKKSYIW